MTKGRGSAGGIAQWAVVAGVMLCMVVQFESVEAAVYTVGDSGGWTFDVASWPNGKRFRAGDVLKFNYDPTAHNVVGVGKGGYSNCRSPGGAKVYKSGKDQIKLVKGLNYFICNFPGHCESGMKIAVNAA